MITSETGQAGEQVAADYLRKNGYDILEMNYQNNSGRRLGEIDIIAKDKKADELVFVEVKTRDYQKYGATLPEENITRDKLKKLSRIASAYLNQKDLRDASYRFDAISVWLDFETRAQLLSEQMKQMQPEIESSQKEMIAQLEPSKKEMEHMRREIEKSMKQQQKEIDKMSRKIAASSMPAQKEMEQMQQGMQRFMPSQKDLDEMKQQFQSSMPSEKDMEDMKAQALASMPSQTELDDMRQNIEKSMQNLTPQLQQEMQQMQKQMEQQKVDLQQMMKEFSNGPQF